MVYVDVYGFLAVSLSLDLPHILEHVFNVESTVDIVYFG